MKKPLEVNNIDVAYDKKIVVNNVSFSLEPGHIGCLLGPSGCGKTTLLRAIAGFEPVKSGEIHLNGHEVSKRGWALPPEKRNVGMVFQDLALFPHLNITDNISFGIHTLSSTKRTQRVQELLTMVGLSGTELLYPHQLSGGQQQRIALARAIAPKPALLLLDEPFANIDVELREQLAREVRDILRQEEISGVLVTHDQYEAFAMADEIGVMNAGKIAQWDTGYNLYHRPADRFVADFIGQGMFLSGVVLNDQQLEIELGVINGQVPTDCAAGCPVDVLVRPDDVIHDDASTLTAKVESKAFRGAEFLYTLRLASGSLVYCLAPSHHNHVIGEPIGIRLEIDHLVVFPRG